MPKSARIYMPIWLRPPAIKGANVGTDDHVHLAVRLSRTLTSAKLVEKLKTQSSKWLKTQSPSTEAFAGYGVFSLGASGQEALLQRGAYIVGLSPQAWHRHPTQGVALGWYISGRWPVSPCTGTVTQGVTLGSSISGLRPVRQRHILRMRLFSWNELCWVATLYPQTFPNSSTNPATGPSPSTAT
jgi:hypothetical protein